MDTKERILLGMLELIQEVGLEKASIGKLCKKISISPGNIYFYFDSKKVLIDTLYEYCVVKTIDHLDQERLLESVNNIEYDECKELTSELIRRFIDFYQENPLIFHFVITSKSSYYLSNDIKKGRYKKNKSFNNFVEQSIKQKILKPISAEYIMTFMIGVVYEFLKESLIFGNLTLEDKDIDTIIDLIWSALECK